MPKHSKKKAQSNEISEKCQFDHQLQLQLLDSLGFPVAGTEFWIKLTIIKDGTKVTVQFPVINFQTGPSANNPLELPPLLPGGYLYTADGFLPKSIWPSDLVYRSIVAASDNGLSIPYSFLQSSLPTPPVGYILSVTDGGAVSVQGAGTFGNIIPPGPQTLMPTEITYILKPRPRLCKNFIIDSGFTNTTQFTGGLEGAAGTQLRDSHVNDAFDNVLAWAWTSNANQVDKTNNVLNVFVAVGTVTDTKVSVDSPIQLTNFPAGVFAWDTAVAINRTNKNNIVVSWSVLNAPGTPSRAVSFDGGKTWPINGPTNIQPTGVPSGAGDNRGVAADKFGNIWYGTTNLFDNAGNVIDQPTFWISTDGGVNYSVAYTLPVGTSGALFFDFPQYCFGNDASGNYGLWFSTDTFPNTSGDLFIIIGFIPITGLGSYGTATVTSLTNLRNANSVANLTASNDGRLWIQGDPNLNDGPVDAFKFIAPLVVTFKSPGPIDQNYAGPWQMAIYNQGGGQYLFSTVKSQPNFGYFTPPRSILYDNDRQALYAIVSMQTPAFGQNMQLNFLISRDNGQTWSTPLRISTTDFANRGFQSMALDPITRDLVFGWYDGRNDPTFTSVQYFGAVLKASTLDEIVDKIPLSNPLYQIPAGGIPPVSVAHDIVKATRLKKASSWQSRLSKVSLSKPDPK